MKLPPDSIQVDTTKILDVPVGLAGPERAIALVDAWISARQGSFVCFRDVHGIVRCQDDDELKAIHHRAGLVAADGVPLVWIARWRGYRQISRVSGADFVPAFCAHSVSKGYRHFFYGGAEGVADQLAEGMAARHAGLEVAGTYTPPFRPLTEAEKTEVTELIEASGADVVWVGLSTPKQEYWMGEFSERLTTKVLFGVGAAFDYNTGRVKRAPRWMQHAGLEWAFRLICEPKRLWRRYLIDMPRFLWLLVRETMRAGKRDGDGDGIGDVARSEH